MQLAVSLIVGRPWLGYFHVPKVAEERGKVVLVLGEEDREEVHRRLYNVCEALGLGATERALVEEALVVLPLRGEPCGLLEGDESRVFETFHLKALRQELVAGGPWSLIVLDPSARLAGINAEGSNVLATRWVQAAESLCEVPGKPTVLVLGHSSKEARKTGKADARGVSGQEDAYRWAATLNGREDQVEFAQVKSNYSKPMADPVILHRDENGLLGVQSAVDAQKAEVKAKKAEQEKLEIDLREVIAAAQKHRSMLPVSKTALADLTALRRKDAFKAIAEGIRRGVLLPDAGSGHPRYSLADPVPEAGGN